MNNNYVVKEADIQVSGGGYVNLISPDCDSIDIHDIAHSLSNTGRFGGHAKQLYSVAQHCVLGSYKTKNKHIARAFMFHDASEAYLVDMPTPLKLQLPDYKTLETDWEIFLSDTFFIDYPFNAEVKKLDLEALATERRDLLHQDGEWSILKNVTVWPEKIHAWHPLYANYRFLKRLAELGDYVNVPSPVLPVIMQAFQRLVYAFV